MLLLQQVLGLTLAVFLGLKHLSLHLLQNKFVSVCQPQQ